MLSQKEEEAKRQEQERLKAAEEQTRQEEDRRLGLEQEQRQDNYVTPVLPIPPTLIGDYPAPPTAPPSAPPAEDLDPSTAFRPGSNAVIGDNHREHSAPATKPAFTSLFSVPSG